MSHLPHCSSYHLLFLFTHNVCHYHDTRTAEKITVPALYRFARRKSQADCRWDTRPPQNRRIIIFISTHQFRFRVCCPSSLQTLCGRATITDNRHPPSYYAELYKRNNLTGGHVIKLGPKNDEAAKEACQTWPNSLQVGGGITLDNAQEWLDAGASKVCPSTRSKGKLELTKR